MENNPALLKSSVFGGFKKKDVLSYIFELNEATQDEKQKLAEQIEELVQSRETLSQNAADMEKQIAELKSSLDDVTLRLNDEAEKNAQASELIAKLKAEASRHEATVARQKNELANQAAINAELAEKNRVHEEKRNQVELAASQIAEFLGQAKKDADNVVARAQVEARDIIKNARDSIEAHVDEANESVDAAYKKFSEFRMNLEALHETIEDAASAMTGKMKSLMDSVSEIEKLAPEKLSAQELPGLKYQKVDEPKAGESKADGAAPVKAAVSPSVEAEAADMTASVLRRYGVRKDDSGFFRLASD